MPTVPIPGGNNNPVKRAIDARARRVPRSKRARYTAAAYETAPVEASWGNPSGGDADSGGWRQERRSIYGSDNTNITHSVDRFFNELAQHDRGQPSYELAADVQRPRADLRGRYREHHADAIALLKQSGVIGGGRSVPRARSAAAAPSSSTSFKPTETTEFDQAGYDQAVRRQRVAALLQKSGKRNSVLFKSGLLSADPVNPQDFSSSATALMPTTTTRRSRPSSSQQPGGGSGVQAAISAANKYLGVKEVGSSNRGAEVDKLQQGFGMVGQPWCGIYVGTVLKRAGVKGVDARVASVSEIETMARNKDGAFSGGWHSAAHARAGDALVTRQGQHVAFVEKVDSDGTIHVIGGNQGNGEVNRRTWKPNEVYGVARPRYGTPRRARPRR